MRCKRTGYYIILTAAERSLALTALLHFRNKAISHHIDPVDIDGLIQKLTK